MRNALVSNLQEVEILILGKPVKVHKSRFRIFGRGGYKDPAVGLVRNKFMVNPV